MPYINSNKELIQINSLIQLLLNKAIYINNSAYSIIRRIFSNNTGNNNLDFIYHILENSQILDNKNIYFFIENLNNNINDKREYIEENILKDIFYDMVKLLIIDEYKNNIINKIYVDNTKNMRISNIVELVQENKILLYI